MIWSVAKCFKLVAFIVQATFTGSFEIVKNCGIENRNGRMDMPYEGHRCRP